MNWPTDERAAEGATRLLRHIEAKTDGGSPYRGPTPHDPPMSYTFDHDLWTADVKAVVIAYLRNTAASAAPPASPAPG